MTKRYSVYLDPDHETTNEVVLAGDYDALAARLAEAERLLQWVAGCPYTVDEASNPVVLELSLAQQRLSEIRAFLRPAVNEPEGRTNG